MGLSLEDLAKEKPFENDSEYRKLFKELDNVCTEGDNNKNIVSCDTFDKVAEGKSFESLLQKIFTILRRSHIQNNIYLNNIKPLKYDSCVYYKYWFYHKLITDNIDNVGINEIYTTWKSQMNAFSNSIRIPCKFHANTLEDVKIIKVLYDHILFLSIGEKENVLKEIEKCEFCDYFKNSVQDFISDNNNTCSTASTYVFCMEHNDYLKNTIDLNDVLSLTCKYDVNLSHTHQHQETFGKERGQGLSLAQQEGNVMSNVGEDYATSLLPENIEENKLVKKE